MFKSEKYISEVQIFSKINKQSSDTVHIALAFDDNYAMPAGVTITSIIYNNPNIHLCFHLFVDQIANNNLEKFKQFVNNSTTIKIYYLNSNFQINSDTLILGYLSPMSCVRFIIPELLKNETDKLLYVDSDILCLKSISPLYNNELSNYVAGVIPDDDTMKNAVKDLYSINSENYFNAGVLLINTKKWVENDITTLCMNKINDGNIYRFADQDVLNILLENKTLQLPIKYNTKIQITTSCKEEKAIPPYIVMLHYVTGYKPWYQTFNSQLFQKFFCISPWKDTKRPLALKRSWLRHYAKFCLKNGKFITGIRFYCLYLFKKKI
ncbi:glycosyltransferase family 8 protein [Gilliamella sp. wkB108]|uniref:glycosyltransferase family 8 protein n=1 Tax=Gilliamella sp. wkB108 TaxID=3120256 RepID=UPI0009BE6C43|nr:glycosyltransferase [Gilliamella apicola]